jgi:type II secretory pathway component HofQ
VAAGATGARIAPEATGLSTVREAKGWLQLDSDQRAARARTEPLTPLQSQQIQIRERQERMRLMETYQQQRREIDALRRAERRGSEPGGSRFDRGARKQGLMMRQDRELEGLRLRQGMERERLGIPPGPYRRR